MTNELMMIIVSTVTTFLVTYFLMAQGSRKTAKAYSQELIESHELHKHVCLMDTAATTSLIERGVDKHIEECGGVGAKRLQRIELALVWLIVKHDGNPKDLGLD
jgi:hypothetical protein